MPDLAFGRIDAHTAVINNRHKNFIVRLIVKADKEAGSGHQAANITVQGFGNRFNIQGGGEGTAHFIENRKLLGAGLGFAEELGIFNGDADLLAGHLHEG